MALEQLYLDYTLSPAATLRAGLVLPPIGIINETHEPPTFNGVERPGFDNDVIPTHLAGHRRRHGRQHPRLVRA